ITFAESAAVKLPLVGSTQLEPPPHATSAAAAAIAILLCISTPSSLGVRLRTGGRQGTAGGAVGVEVRRAATARQLRSPARFVSSGVRLSTAGAARTSAHMPAQAPPGAPPRPAELTQRLSEALARRQRPARTRH